ncbi:hypothetical protein K440DRAFT_566444, partial [Wilcoxina mikolae CBS 423.85]
RVPLKNLPNIIPAEPFEILSLFLTESLLEDIEAHSNAYTAANVSEQQLEGGRNWKEISASEVGIWLEIVLYMGVHDSLAVRDYLRHDRLNPTHPICEYMSQARFEQIKRYFHVFSPDILTIAPTGRQLWYNKINIILDQLWDSSQRHHIPSTHISLYECLMRATGVSPDMYKMASKPIEQGFKFHSLADYRYIWDDHPISIQAGPNPVLSTDGKCWQRSGSVRHASNRGGIRNGFDPRFDKVPRFGTNQFANH